MKNSEILHILLLDAFEYEDYPLKVKTYLKTYVNNAIDNLEWVNGFEIAVKSGELDHDEYCDLINAIRMGFPEIQLNKELLFTNLKKDLPYFFIYAGASWLTGDGFIVFSDDHSIGMYQNDKFIWITPRISIDGIILEKITTTSVIGQYWDGSSEDDTYSPNCNFEVDLNNGFLLHGEVVD